MGDHVSAERRLRELLADLEGRSGNDPVHPYAVRRMLQNLAGCAQADAREARKAGFDAGFNLAARVEQHNARAALGRYVLEVLGKDRGDGLIDLGALGLWHAGSERFDGAREVER